MSAMHLSVPLKQGKIEHKTDMLYTKFQTISKHSRFFESTLNSISAVYRLPIGISFSPVGN